MDLNTKKEELKIKKEAINMLMKIMPDDVPGVKAMKLYTKICHNIGDILEQGFFIDEKDEAKIIRTDNFLVEIDKLMTEFMKQENIKTSWT